jgi:hypothetical protein
MTDFVCDSCVRRVRFINRSFCLATWLGGTLPLVMLGKHLDEAKLQLGLFGLPLVLLVFSTILVPIFCYSPDRKFCGSTLAMTANKGKLKQQGCVGFGRGNLVFSRK